MRLTLQSIDERFGHIAEVCRSNGSYGRYLVRLNHLYNYQEYFWTLAEVVAFLEGHLRDLAIGERL